MSTSVNRQPVHPDVVTARNLIDVLGLDISAAIPDSENAEYGAFVSVVGRGSVRFRVGKLTPTKVGSFVSVWQRAADGSTVPFAAESGADLLVITVREGAHCGQFVFPRNALAEHGIMSVAGCGGKRGFRVYPPWSAAQNSQARNSQKWQCGYFLDLDGENIDLSLARNLYEPVWPINQ
ncbi:MepB family protein [Nocardia sp. NPDC058705]|uniref:MepB family protein n=1 Tax=Nocardia sp. NPDC058705 TaxID=3346609 RepID=UPI0036BAD28B